MLTSEQIANLKPGDQIRFAGLPALWNWDKSNGIVVTVVNPSHKILDSPCIEFEPPIIRTYNFEGVSYTDKTSLISYSYVELVTETNHACMCDIIKLLSVGCKCGGY